jgi:hypothetical protein
METQDLGIRQRWSIPALAAVHETEGGAKQVHAEAH